MDLNGLLANVISKIEINATLRAETTQRLSAAVDKLNAAQDAEAEAVEAQRLAKDEIVALKASLDQCEATEKGYASDLKALQGMLTPPEVVDPEPEAPQE